MKHESKHHFTTTVITVIMAVDAKDEILQKIQAFLTLNNASQDDIAFVSAQMNVVKTLNTTDTYCVTEADINNFSDNVGTGDAVRSYTICAQNDARVDRSRSLHVFMGISNKDSRKILMTVSLDDLNKISTEMMKNIKYRQPKGLKPLKVLISSSFYHF